MSKHEEALRRVIELEVKSLFNSIGNIDCSSDDKMAYALFALGEYNGQILARLQAIFDLDFNQTMDMVSFITNSITRAGHKMFDKNDSGKLQ